MTLELSEKLKTDIETIAARYPERRSALLPALHLIQDELGHLSPDVQAAIAEFLRIPPAYVREVVTFYEMFHEHPEAQFHLELCTNMVCHLRGADALKAHLVRRLGIEVGTKSPDGVFGIAESECLGSCGSGPVMRVGADYFEYLSAAALDHLIDEFRKIAPSLHGHPYHGRPGEPHVGPVRGFEPPPSIAPGDPTATNAGTSADHPPAKDADASDGTVSPTTSSSDGQDGAPVA